MKYYKNIFLIGSPWHAIIIRNFYSKNDGIIIEYTSKTSLDSIKNSLDNRHKIILCVNSRDFFLSNILFKKPAQLFSLKKNILELISKFKKIKANNLFISNENSFLADIVMPLDISKNYFKTEDGINDYLPFSLVQNKFLKKILKPLITKITRTENYYFPSKKPKINKKYFFFPNKINDNKIKISLFNYKKKIISNLKKLENNEKTIIKKNSTLFIGQTLYEDNYCDFESEIKIYKKVIQYFKDRSNYIYFKPHPRTSARKINELNKIAKKYKIFKLLKSNYPVEVMLTKYKFLYVIGLWSASIILSRKLFNIKSYTIIPMLLEIKKNFFLLKIHRVLKKKFPLDYLDFREIK